MTPEARKESLDATATERASTLTPPVKDVTVLDLHKRVAELEGKPLDGDVSNEFHQTGNVLRDTHGEHRATFIQKLTSDNVVDSASVPLFLKLLNEYECAGGSDAPYPLCDGSGTEKYGDGDPYGISEYTDQSFIPTQSEFEAAEAKSAGVDVRPSEEKSNG